MKVEGIHLNFGRVKALNGVNFSVRHGEVLAIIGPNGAGKTCIVNCVNGFYRPQKGRIYFQGNDITHMKPHKICAMGVARVFQNVELYTGLTVLENLMAARHSKMKQSIFGSALWYGPALREEVKNRKIVEEIIDFLEIQNIRQEPVGMLSYGLKSLRISVCKDGKLEGVGGFVPAQILEPKERYGKYWLTE